MWAGASPGMRLLIVLANLGSVVCLWWALSDSEISKLRVEIRTIDWRWVFAGAAADVMVYVVQGWRWRILLSPISSVRMAQTVRAIYEPKNRCASHWLRIAPMHAQRGPPARHPYAGRPDRA